MIAVILASEKLEQWSEPYNEVGHVYSLNFDSNLVEEHNANLSTRSKRMLSSYSFSFNKLFSRSILFPPPDPPPPALATSTSFHSFIYLLFDFLSFLLIILLKENAVKIPNYSTILSHLLLQYNSISFVDLACGATIPRAERHLLLG